jgi:hypothetical protein
MGRKITLRFSGRRIVSPVSSTNTPSPSFQSKKDIFLASEELVDSRWAQLGAESPLSFAVGLLKSSAFFLLLLGKVATLFGGG